ncbi:MAG: 3-deoxy-manno-octulosonate cytidylyltransferase [Phycisphaeraceae bacterium]|nr:3-deoxy-manno-octulosonate cytidylyltransferase [Phycisphaeraceae bacterium]
MSSDGSAPTLAVIPARYASTRFPGKPLADETGRPLIQHVLERVQQAASIDRAVVATDDDRIAEAVNGFGGQAIMTDAGHPNGTSRIAEAVDQLGVEDDTLVINVQGDEPEIEPGVIDELVAGLRDDPDAPMATLASPFADDESPADPNIVKVIVDRHGRAIYFSRAPIPFDRDESGSTYLKHPGCYAYRKPFLATYVGLEPTPLEQIEKLEQLRALEHGYAIRIVQTDVRHHGIDTPEQYARFVARQQRD